MSSDTNNTFIHVSSCLSLAQWERFCRVWSCLSLSGEKLGIIPSSRHFAFTLLKTWLKRACQWRLEKDSDVTEGSRRFRETLDFILHTETHTTRFQTVYCQASDNWGLQRSHGGCLEGGRWKGRRTAAVLGTRRSHHYWEPSVLLKVSDDDTGAAGMGQDEKHQVGNGAGVENRGLIISQIWGQVRKDERKS